MGDESQFYRIDHFLGKETVQSIMAIRFANGMFEPTWRREYIDHVEITAAETVGVEERGSFYEPTGALRDMVPNHMFQLLSVVAMEPPNSFEAEAVRSEKAKLIQAVRPVSPGRGRARPIHGLGACSATILARLSAGAACLPGVRYGNLCGAQANDRELAVDWGAFLRSHWQADGRPAH